AGAGNVIACNGGAGVAVVFHDSTGNRILGNSIDANGGLGIDLGNDGITRNDAGDADTGPNNLQNYPELATATSSMARLLTVITGSVRGPVGAHLRLEFFSSPLADPSGFGEGRTFLGSRDVDTPPGGWRDFLFETSLVPAPNVVSATATDSGDNTSEFSPSFMVAATMFIKDGGGSSNMPGGKFAGEAAMALAE